MTVRWWVRPLIIALFFAAWLKYIIHWLYHLVEKVFFSLDGLGWLLLALVPLVLAQRLMHREIQLVLLLLTRNARLVLVLFSLLFFPGVLLHELSHYLMAVILRVRTGHFSLLPGLTPEGKLRLGYVETAGTDIIRDGLIGTAPLITGGALIAYLGANRLGFVPLAAFLGRGDWSGFWQGLLALPGQSDFWLWFYLAFTISSTMLPSASDRRAWLPLSLAALVLVGFALLTGAGPWMLEHLAPWFNRALRSLSVVFAVSLAIHMVMLAPFFIMRLLIQKVSGLRIVEERA